MVVSCSTVFQQLSKRYRMNFPLIKKRNANEIKGRYRYIAYIAIAYIHSCTYTYVHSCTYVHIYTHQNLHVTLLFNSIPDLLKL